MRDKPTSKPVCPKCKSPLFFDAKGLRCTKCVYLWRPDKVTIAPADPPPLVLPEEPE